MRLREILDRDVQWEVAKAQLVLNVERDLLCRRLERILDRIVGRR